MNSSMVTLQSVARGTASLVGRNSPIIQKMRPTYERLLDRSSGGKGIPWCISGQTYRIDLRNRNCFPPVYEPELANALRKRVKPGSVCLDVGANIGVYALQLAAWSQPGGRIIAFEPNPGAIRVLSGIYT
jgi:hypothetical protein